MLCVAIHPPSKEMLEQRVRSIEGVSEEEMEARVELAVAELETLGEERNAFDEVVIVNDDIEESYSEL